MKRTGLLLSCEHASNSIPQALWGLFLPQQGLLNTHEGYDIGALDVAKILAEKWNAPLFNGSVSRLVVDLNRSLHHQNCFSRITTTLPPAQKREIIETYYRPYREAIQQFIEEYQPVLHLSIHSFTPILRGINRNADLGLLYDPARSNELALAAQWINRLKQLHPTLRVRRNYPYLGKGDGLTSYLRKRFPTSAYCGFEIEMNQTAIMDLDGQRVFAQKLGILITHAAFKN